MVVLSTVQALNARASIALPPGVVAVFAGATSGIGELALRSFARHAPRPRIYFIGRSREAGDRLTRELKELNAEGEYVFVQADLSLMKNVDEVSEMIKAKETAINVLFMSQGTLRMSGETSEGLPYLMAVSFYSRARLAANLVPLIRRAHSLRRVVSTLAGTKEGRLYVDDIAARRSVPLRGARGHLASAITLSLEALAARRTDGDVSFVHNFPGSVNTDLIRREDGLLLQGLKWWFKLSMGVRGVFMDKAECGERHAFFCLAGAYPPRRAGDGDGDDDDARGVTFGDEEKKNESGESVRLPVVRGTDGVVGSGVYSVDWDNESVPDEVIDVLDKQRAEGMVDKVWDHLEGEFRRIMGSGSA